MLSKPWYINSSGKKVLQYLSQNSIFLDMPFILTRGKRLTINMPYMKLEKRVAGNDIAAIRLLNFKEDDGIVSLNVQELATNKCYNLNWNLEFDGDWWFWSLSDLSTLTDLPK